MSVATASFGTQVRNGAGRREVISVCQAQESPGDLDVPAALAMLARALATLAAADVGSLPTESQAALLRGLEQAESRHTAARARALAAFAAQGATMTTGSSPPAPG